jgi:hypothetical protein
VEDCRSRENKLGGWATTNNAFKSHDGGRTWSANGEKLVFNGASRWTGSQVFEQRTYRRALNITGFMVPSRIVAQEAIAILTTPLLARFLAALDSQDESWSRALVERLQALCDGRTPTLWGCRLTASEAPAAWQALMHERTIRLGDLLRDGTERSRPLAAVVLLIERNEACHLLPDAEFKPAASYCWPARSCPPQP